MAATPKGYSAAQIHQGPGRAWIIAPAPLDASPRLVLAPDGSPDSGTYTTAIDLGLFPSAASFLAKTKLEPIQADQADSEVDAYGADVECTTELELGQLSAPLIQQSLGVGVYSTVASPGYNQMTFGGITTVPSACIALISPRRDLPGAFVYTVLFMGMQTGPLTFAFGRTKPVNYKLKLEGATDLTRTAGQQVGVAVRQLVATANTGAVSAGALNPALVQQGPADLWIVGTPPIDSATPQLTLTGLTPDSVAHPNSVDLGITESAVTLTLTPTIEKIKADQAQGFVDAFCVKLKAKLEATLMQGALSNLQNALGLTGAYSIASGGTPAWEMLGFGGGSAPMEFAVAVIAPKRSNAAKCWVGLLFKVISTQGVTVMMSRAKPNAVKVAFEGLADLTRTAGRQQGVVYETT